MKVFNGLDEFVAAAGSELGPTDWMEITQDRVNLFADAPMTISGFTSIPSGRPTGRSGAPLRTVC